VSLFSDITGAISGAGSIAGAVKALAEVAKQALGMAHEKEQRNEGATAQDDTTKTATLDTIERVNAPVPTADLERMWNANKARYGALEQPADKAK
jgi:hypothetical protein